MLFGVNKNKIWRKLVAHLDFQLGFAYEEHLMHEQHQCMELITKTGNFFSASMTMHYPRLEFYILK